MREIITYFDSNSRKIVYRLERNFTLNVSFTLNVTSIKLNVTTHKITKKHILLLVCTL
jgi:hypothetical protein